MMAYKRYSLDPKWLTARFASKCAKCNALISKGDEIFYYPNGKRAYGSKCGCADDASGDFEAAAFDESVYSGQY